MRQKTQFYLLHKSAGCAHLPGLLVRLPQQLLLLDAQLRRRGHVACGGPAAGCLDEEEAVQSESGFQVTTNDVLKLTLGVSVIGSIMLIFSIQRERNASYGDGKEQLREELESK